MTVDRADLTSYFDPRKIVKPWQQVMLLTSALCWVGGDGASQLLRVKSFVDIRQSPRGSAHRPPPTAYE